MLFYITVIFAVLLKPTTVDAKFFSKSIARERLASDLFANYNPSTRPASKGERLDVNVNIELQHFDFRETDGAFNIVGLFNAEWNDKKLIWNPKDYNNITQMSVSQRSIWVPDFEMYNNAPDKFLRMHRNGFAVVNSVGAVTWSDVIELTIFCSTNMHLWPRDHHSCELILGSWTYSGLELDIGNDPNTSLSFDDDHIQNMQYEIVNYSAEHISVKYASFEEIYITMKYKIEFKRREGFGTVFYSPAYPIIILTLLALGLKPDRGEKILLNGFNFIVITLQLLYFAKSVGKFARATPYIVVFYSCSLVIVTFSHLLCVFSLWTTRTNYNGKPLPIYISNFLNGPFVRYILPVQNNTTNHEDIDPQFEEVKLSDYNSLIPRAKNTTEWVQFAVFLERVGMILFGFIFFLLASICLI